jgi:carboxyl-terminal processing protease
MRGLIIDLRDNPGGLLAVTTEFLEPLLPANTLVVSTRGRNGVPDEILKTTGDGDVHYKGPVVVLVNENTASAAEIVAGALQDNHRAVILGTRTYGKGIVQSVYDLSDGTGMKLTTQAYYLPGNSPAGRSIQDVGITPDVIMPQSDDEREILRLQRGDLRFIEAEKTTGVYRQAPSETIFTGQYGFAPLADAQVEAADALIRAVTPDVP